MWQEKLSYKITDKTLLNIVSIEKNLAIINQTETQKNLKGSLHQDVLFDDLFSLSNALNFNLTLAEVKRVLVGQSIESKESQILLNVRQVFDYVNNNFRKESLSFNFNFIQHIVKLLHSEIFEVWDVGKIRSGSENVESLYELPNQQYLQQDIINFLAESAVWIENDMETHPIIKATVFLMFINTTSPFIGMNFISSMVLFRLILEKYGYGNNFSIPLFKIFTFNNRAVVDHIEESLNKNNHSFSETITIISQALDEVITKYKNEYVKFDYLQIKGVSNNLDLNDRQIKLLTLLQNKVNIKRREYIKIFKVSPMTAYRDLNYLLEQKLLAISGEGKATMYTLSSKA